MDALLQLEQAAREVLETVGPAVVGTRSGHARGSGLVIGQDRVLTNAHNIAAASVGVAFADGRGETGEVVGIDPDRDLAVLAVETAGVGAPEWGEGPAAVGSAVFALANPGGRGVRVTFGLVAATDQAFRGPAGRRITGSLEHSAPLSRGSSGGPVVDPSGRLLGINTNRLGDGFYLAIPAVGDLTARVTALSRGESPARPRLRIGLAPAGAARRLREAVGLPERAGVLVRAVDESGPGGRAGLQPGDLIVAAAGRDVASVDDLHGVLDDLGPGDALELSVVRGTEERSVTVTFDEGADPSSPG